MVWCYSTIKCFVGLHSNSRNSWCYTTLPGPSTHAMSQNSPFQLTPHFEHQKPTFRWVLKFRGASLTLNTQNGWVFMIDGAPSTSNTKTHFNWVRFRCPAVIPHNHRIRVFGRSCWLSLATTPTAWNGTRTLDFSLWAQDLLGRILKKYLHLLLRVPFRGTRSFTLRFAGINVTIKSERKYF